MIKKTRKKYSTGTKPKRDFPALRDSQKTFNNFLKKKGIKKLDFEDVKKVYKIFTKK